MSFGARGTGATQAPLASERHEGTRIASLISLRLPICPKAIHAPMPHRAARSSRFSCLHARAERSTLES